ncbi:ROK family transcriptional regulator [Kineococcus sp. SYSU DK001]|uniref:ROK family transcriptional regulator n=1 Tax=Kineococcus sp. SYSU DK001 TaxID=3383122 RepID=UPI003D7D7DB4
MSGHDGGNGRNEVDGLSSTLQLLRDGRPRTRAELGRLTGQSRSTVSQRIDRLVAARLVSHVGGAASTGGRPPATFAFNPAARVVLAIDLGATRVRVALTDLAATVLTEERRPVSVAEGPRAVLDLVAEVAQQLLTSSGRALGEVAGVGIGLPGPVDHTTGRPTHPPIMPGWHDADVGGGLRSRLGNVPVVVDNDVNTMAVGEHVTTSPHVDHLLFVKVATGIGAGIITDGRLVRGAQGTAGDLGHIAVPGGPDVPCRCGSSGCLEAVAGGRAVAATLAAAGFPTRSSSDVAALASAGAPDAVAAVRDAGRSIGRVLAGCVSLLNPSVIVVGGSLATAGDHLLAGVRETVHRRPPDPATQHLRIVASRAGTRAGVVGASAVVLEQLMAGALLNGITRATRGDRERR